MCGERAYLTNRLCLSLSRGEGNCVFISCMLLVPGLSPGLGAWVALRRGVSLIERVLGHGSKGGGAEVGIGALGGREEGGGPPSGTGCGTT